MSTLFVVPSFSKKNTKSQFLLVFSSSWKISDMSGNLSSPVVSFLADKYFKCRSLASQSSEENRTFLAVRKSAWKKNGGFYEVKKLRQKMGSSLKIPIGTDFFPALATKSEYIAARNKWLRRNTVCVSFWGEGLFSLSSCSGSVSTNQNVPHSSALKVTKFTDPSNEVKLFWQRSSSFPSFESSFFDVDVSIWQTPWETVHILNTPTNCRYLEASQLVVQMLYQFINHSAWNLFIH